MKTNSGYIKGFDGLRAISILFVLMTHLGFYPLLSHSEFFTQRVLMLINGTAGVNIFFAISGFLITTILLREKLSRGRIDFKNFFIRRFLRLLPTLLVFYIVIFILMTAGFIDRTYAGFLFSFFYLYNFVPNKYYTGELGHTWSLAVEEQFYLFWPFAVNAMRKYRLLAISGIILALCIVSIIIVPYLYLPYHGKIFYLNYIFNPVRWFLPAAGSIMIGASVAVLNFYKDPRIIHFFASGLCLALSIVLYFSPLYMPYQVFGYIFIPQELGISLFLVWIFHNQNALITNILEIKPLAFIGKISYGIYVWQGLFLKTGPGGSLAIQHFPLNIILVFIVASVSYYTVERYALSFKEKFK